MVELTLADRGTDIVHVRLPTILIIWYPSDRRKHTSAAITINENYDPGSSFLVSSYTLLTP